VEEKQEVVAAAIDHFMVKYPLIIVFFFFCFAGLSAQDSLQHYKKRKLDPAEVDILFGYYRQDGKHSPVTGGKGTEELQDYSPAIILHIPVDTNKSVNIEVGLDAYTSASTDNIDYRVTSASYKDYRGRIRAGYEQKFEKAGVTAGLNGSFSLESDYLSRGFGWSVGKEFDNGNNTLSLNGNIFFDVVGWGWGNADYYRNVKIIYPVELRDTNWFDDGRRNTFSFDLSWSANLSKRSRLAVFAGYTYQEGLLSTSFHRVYFKETEDAKVEILPSTRMKIPAGIRYNYYLSDFMIIRSYYRFYADTWGIRAHTASLEIPFKITPFLSLYPTFRYHAQKGTRYFAPYKEHSVNTEYYTSDYDLSTLNSREIGAGVRYSPPLGLMRFKFSKKGRKTMLQRFELRYVYYMRSDGLKAHSISMALSFTGL
jgi:hypothetical protein